jgi:hypothetical protein
VTNLPNWTGFRRQCADNIAIDGRETGRKQCEKYIFERQKNRIERAVHREWSSDVHRRAAWSSA